MYPEIIAGFRRGRSSKDSVIELVTSVQHEKHLRRLITALFLNAKGAYANLALHAIRHAPEAAGIGAHVFRWIRSYLYERSFLTEDGITPSSYTSRGVQQGGVLSLADSLLQSVQLTLYICGRYLHMGIRSDTRASPRTTSEDLNGSVDISREARPGAFT